MMVFVQPLILQPDVSDITLFSVVLKNGKKWRVVPSEAIET